MFFSEVMLQVSCAQIFNAFARANVLVNTRISKLRQMRWSPRGAQRVRQARTAVIDGRLRAGAISRAA